MEDKTASGELDATSALCELFEREARRRDAIARKICVSTAHLPMQRTFEDFDQPSLNREEVLQLRYLRFVEEAGNVFFIGSPGVGKTHLACALGMCAAEQRMPTYFVRFPELLERLVAAKRSNTLERSLSAFARYKLLIVDEVGFLPVTQEEAALFFQLVSLRYEKKSTVITTNKPIAKWTETFGDPVLTNAILDRLLHHAKVIKIVGQSYRTRELASELAKNSAANP